MEDERRKKMKMTSSKSKEDIRYFKSSNARITATALSNKKSSV
jgi:hypothetical protein